MVEIDQKGLAALKLKAYRGNRIIRSIGIKGNCRWSISYDNEVATYHLDIMVIDKYSLASSRANSPNCRMWIGGDGLTIIGDVIQYLFQDVMGKIYEKHANAYAIKRDKRNKKCQKIIEFIMSLGIADKAIHVAEDDYEREAILVTLKNPLEKLPFKKVDGISIIC